MRYWTLFALRMLARAGLLLAVAVWLSSASRPKPWHGRFDSRHVEFQNSLSSLSIEQLSHRAWIRRLTADFDMFTSRHSMARAAETDWQSLVPNEELTDLLRIPGLSVGSDGTQIVRMEVDHWFLCLTFLIATIATSVRWRKKPADSEQEQADEW